VVAGGIDREMGAGSLPGAVAQPAWLPGGGILTAAQDRGESALWIAGQPADGRWVGKDASVVGWYSVARSGVRAGDAASAQQTPAEGVLLNLEPGNKRQLTNLNREWLGVVPRARGEKFVVATEAGTEVDCWLMKPTAYEDGKSYPLILNVHGGPFGQYGEPFLDEFQVYAAA